MARNPDHAFERNARAKATAEKREAKRQTKLAARASGRAGSPEAVSRVVDVAGGRLTGRADSGQADDA